MEHHAVLESTNGLAARRAGDGAPEGLLIRADRQERGRGQRERNWHSPPGGLWLTALLRPPKLEGLSLAAGLACVRAVRAWGARATLRWPNDVYVADRKLAGILTEGRLTGSRIDYALVGVGLNVNLEIRDFPEELRGLATSLALETGHPVDLEAVCEAVVDELDAIYDLYLSEGLGRLLPEIRAACSTIQRHVRLLTAQGPVEGLVCDLGDDGALHLDGGRRYHSVHRVLVLDPVSSSGPSAEVADRPGRRSRDPRC
jgi:BirA family biotin operon repressor/biotin-[acetyl-CoA-carboxylase] ligase